MISFQKDVFVVSCDLVTDIALHHLADIHRSHDSTLSVFLAPVPQTSADREAANNPKAKKKRDNTGKTETNRIKRLPACDLVEVGLTLLFFFNVEQVNLITLVLT